jgi:hypothetical protein
VAAASKQTQISSEFLVKFPISTTQYFSQSDPVLICLAEFQLVGDEEKKEGKRGNIEECADGQSGNAATRSLHNHMIEA